MLELWGLWRCGISWRRPQELDCVWARDVLQSRGVLVYAGGILDILNNSIQDVGDAV